MPSIVSRELNKYYGHKTNRFWIIMENIYDEKIEDWRDFILKHHLALWDVISSCDIEASKDSTIKNVVPNDIKALLNETNIKNIVVLGKTAYKLYLKYLEKELNIDAIYLPSPSSANAQYSLEKLIDYYSIIKEIT